MMRQRYSRVQEYYDLGQTYNRLFTTDKTLADLAYAAKMELWKKMTAVERENALRLNTTVESTRLYDIRQLIAR